MKKNKIAILTLLIPSIASIVYPKPEFGVEVTLGSGEVKTDFGKLLGTGANCKHH